MDGAAGMEALGTAAQDDGITRLDAERSCVRRDVGPTFINDADHTKRHGDSLDSKPVRTLPLIEYPAKRIVQFDNGLDAGGHRFDTRVIEHQAIEHGAAEVALFCCRHVLAVGCDDSGGAIADCRRRPCKCRIALLAGRGRKRRGCGTGRLSKLGHGRGYLWVLWSSCHR